ncbi:MAG: sigma-70 family RNA polymerase sigma factor, partial [Planctomycetota bacterium]
MATTAEIESTTQQVAVNSCPVSEDIYDTWVAYKKDPNNQDLRNRLMERYFPLVKYNGERIWQRLPDGVELDDLVSAGVFGLMDAIDAFDMTRGVKFETYCVPRIRGAMLDELRTMDWVPRLVRSKASRLQEATKALEARLGRHPTEQELADQMSMPVEELERMILEANAVNLISLNKKWYETDSYKDVREIDILEDKKGEDPTRR